MVVVTNRVGKVVQELYGVLKLVIMLVVGDSIRFNRRNNSSFTLNSPGPLCFWQCFLTLLFCELD